MKGLVLRDGHVKVVKGSVVFSGYESLKAQAQDIAEYIETVAVTEDNVKASKKMLAAVNKAVKELEDRRIAVKKAMIEPYLEFEEQVKEIVGIVKGADEVVRSQVRALEEVERIVKREQLRLIWDKRIEHYPFGGSVLFEDFISEQHLNKTMAIDKVEEQMVEYLEKVNSDIKVIAYLEHSDDVLTEYLKIKDLNQAVENVHERHRLSVEAGKIIGRGDASEKGDVYYIMVEGRKDCKMASLLLTENGIEHRIIEHPGSGEFVEM